jgi:hypothetical protein
MTYTIHFNETGKTNYNFNLSDNQKLFLKLKDYVNSEIEKSLNENSKERYFLKSCSKCKLKTPQVVALNCQNHKYFRTQCCVCKKISNRKFLKKDYPKLLFNAEILNEFRTQKRLVKIC